MAFCLAKGGILGDGRWPLGGREVMFCAAVESVWISVEKGVEKGVDKCVYKLGVFNGGRRRWVVQVDINRVVKGKLSSFQQFHDGKKYKLINFAVYAGIVDNLR